MLMSYLLNEGSKLWGKKWRNAILFTLRNGPQRFSEIKKVMGHHCSVKVLSEALDEMERDGLIIRKQYEGIPVKVTYELTTDMYPMGRVLQHYHDALVTFFYKNMDRLAVPPTIRHELEQEAKRSPEYAK